MQFILLRSYGLKDRFPNIPNTDTKSFYILNKSLHPSPTVSLRRETVM